MAASLSPVAEHLALNNAVLSTMAALWLGTSLQVTDLLLTTVQHCKCKMKLNAQLTNVKLNAQLTNKKKLLKIERCETAARLT